MRLTTFALVSCTLFLLAGCSTQREYHYWQKRDPSSALYLTGVKAQQMLEQDISECVHVIIELSKLADVRGRVPALFNPTGSVDQKDITQAMSNLPRWDVPEYIRDLRVDHTNYQDFDGCMSYKGWQRVKYVSPEAERRANEVYNVTGDYSVRPKRPEVEAFRREADALNNGN